MNKYFTVGIAQGITEPEAVRQLANMPNSRVHLFIPTKALSQSSLFAQPLFHPKVVSLTSSDAFWLFVSSGNLTVSSYGDPVRNYEFGQISTLIWIDLVNRRS